LGVAVNSALTAACRYAIEHNLALQPGESVLVITDHRMRRLAEVFSATAREYSDRVVLMEIPVPAANGEEPPGPAALKMQQADVVLILLSRSLSWTRARAKATETGARIASMPGITEETILRTFPVDYRTIRRRVNAICDLLDEAREVQVLTPLETDLRFQIEGRIARGRKGGIYTRKGAWGNLPCGEAFIAPVEGTARGVYKVDASHAGIGKLTDPIEIKVLEGRAVAFQGPSEARVLARLLASVGNAGAYNLAELGIGCHSRASICGITLEDEKSLGTCHLALGSNSFFGGTVSAGIHLDGVLKNPTILLDGKKLMDEGKLRIED
jgi:leucyl aminopeptidase (aminopeptidase T)